MVKYSRHIIGYFGDEEVCLCSTPKAMPVFCSQNSLSCGLCLIYRPLRYWLVCRLCASHFPQFIAWPFAWSCQTLKAVITPLLNYILLLLCDLNLHAILCLHWYLSIRVSVCLFMSPNVSHLCHWLDNEKLEKVQNLIWRLPVSHNLWTNLEIKMPKVYVPGTNAETRNAPWLMTEWMWDHLTLSKLCPNKCHLYRTCTVVRSQVKCSHKINEYLVIHVWHLG